MPAPFTPEELDLARERIKLWPTWDRTVVTQLTEREARLIVLATALLDLTPADPDECDPRTEIRIDLR